MRSSCAFALAAALGTACGGAASPRFDPCETGSPIAIVETEGYSYRAQHALLADDRGYVAFWAGELSPAAADRSGVFAARPGGGVVRLVADVHAQVLSVVPVAVGFLICWTDLSWRAGEWQQGECLTVDADLAIVSGPSRPAYGVVMALGRMADGLYGLIQPDGAIPGDMAPPVLMPVDETAATRGPSVPAPCMHSAFGKPVAWSDAGLVCLLPNHPLCGDQFEEPPDCVYDLHVFGGDGAPVLSVPSVAPYGYYSGWLDVNVAARADGYAVSWIDSDGWTSSWHLQPLAADGTFLPRTDVSLANNGWNGNTLASIPIGYAALWAEPVPDVPGEYRLLRLSTFHADGTLATPPAWLTTPEGELTGHQPYRLAAASAGDGFALAWEASGVASDFTERTGLLFRALGCALPSDADAGPPGCAPVPIESEAPGCPPPAPGPTDCDTLGGAGCFVLPAAAMTVTEGGVEQPPDWSCGASIGPISLSVMPIPLSGMVRSLGDGAPVGGAEAQLFNHGTIAPTAATLAGGDGAFSLEAPRETPEYPTWRTRATGALDTWTWLGPHFDTDAPAITGYDLPLLLSATADDWASAVGRTRDACEDHLVGRVLDCSGRPVAHAIATLTAGQGPEACPIFVAGTRTHYLSGDAPVARAALVETDAGGRFVITGLHPSPVGEAPAIQVYGFVRPEDVAAGAAGLTLLGYGGGLARGGAAQLHDLWPIFGPFP